MDKNPLKGGTPAIEKKISTKENAHNLFVLNKLDSPERNKGDGVRL